MNQPSVFNGYAILAGNAVHEVWDISDPTTPVFEAEMISTHSTEGEAESHQVTYGRDGAGNYYFATITGRGIDIWNVTNTTSPSLVSELILPGINYGDVAGGIWGICWQGDYIYVGATDTGLYVVDVSDPGNPEHVTTMSRTNLGGVSAGPLFALGDLLVVTTPKTSTGIATVDISSPTNPVLLDALDPPGGSYIGGFYGTHAHLEPFRSYDVTTDPRNITAVDVTATDVASEYFSFADDYLYLGGLRGGTEGIWKYDISDLSNPVFVGRIVGRDSGFDDQFSCPVGNLIIVADDQRHNGGYVGAVIAVHETDADTTPPTVKWTSIQDGATNESRSGQIGISFSEWIEFKSVDQSSCFVRPVGGAAVSGQWGCTYTTLTFASAEPLLANTTYEIVLAAGGVTDLVGNAIPSDIITTFTTGTNLPTPPSVIDIDPDLLTELGTPSEFSVNSPDTNLVYEWEFGDGAEAAGADVSHTYLEPGRYNVTYKTKNNPEQYFEAEDADLNGVAIQDNNAGYTGTGFGDYTSAQGSDIRILWTVESPTALTTDLVFRYALGGQTARPLNLVVNGGANVLMPGDPTGGFTNWTDWVAEDISLIAGTNIIELRADAGSAGPNVDHLRTVLAASTEPTEVTLEAEDATFGTGIAEVSHNAGFTGTGYADYPGSQGSDVKITWLLELTEAASLDLNFRYALGGQGSRPLNLVVNGGSNLQLDFNPSGGWTTWSDQVAQDISLNAGTNTIELRADAGSPGANLDHLRVTIPGVPLDNGDDDVIATYSFLHIVHRPIPTVRPNSSGPLLLDGTYVWAVNPDADIVSVVDTATLTLDDEIVVGSEPKSIARAADGTIWITCRKSAEISVIDPSTRVVVDTITMPYASQPSGIAFAPDGSAAFITLEALGQLVKVDATSRSILATLSLGPDVDGITPQVRGVAVNSSSDTVYVTRMISPDSGGEVFEVDAASMTVNQTITLAKSAGIDSSQFSRGLPNYLASITISPDGARAWVPSKKDNIDRGGLRDGLELDHDVTVRAITSSIDLTTGVEVPSERVDHDNGDRCHHCSFSPFGDLAFVSMPGNHEVRIVDAYSGESVNTLLTENVPEGTVLDAATGYLYALNFLSRSLSVFDISSILGGETTAIWLEDISLLTTEPLSAEVLRGKEIFYDAESLEINSSGYMSCASCHLDGSHDGRIYDFSAPMGEGFRNTIDLRGRAGMGHGRVHWTGNFDEIHDFEGQLRDLGKGLGLMAESDFNEGTRSDSLGDPKSGLSSDLDALAAYVASLNEVPPSPYRNSDGSLTADALLGKAHFESLNCFTCHGGESFTDSSLGSLHDVGTLQSTSGQRLGETLTGLDTPTLKGVWATAPYLHDGSAPTLRDVLTTSNPLDTHGAVSTLSSTEIDQLVAYLQQIDELESPALEVTGVNATSYDSFVQSFGLSGDDALAITDFDKDGWTNLEEFTSGGTSPISSSDQPEYFSEFISDATDDYLQISWLRHEGGIWDGQNYRWGDLLYAPLGSTDLQLWNLDFWTVPSPVDLPSAPSGYEWSTSRLRTSIVDEPKAFIHMQITEE